jgi:hypothetical protein
MGWYPLTEVIGAWQLVQYWAVSSLIAPHLVQYLVILLLLRISPAFEMAGAPRGKPATT